jgi:DNA-binding XRE family transcriptional regulator
MLGRMKTLHIEELENNEKVGYPKKSKAKKTKNFLNSSWRDLFKELLETHSEQGLTLKGLRLRDGYTQAQLGEMIGVPQNNISAMERGNRSIGKNIAKKLSGIFKVRYQDFL